MVKNIKHYNSSGGDVVVVMVTLLPMSSAVQLSVGKSSLYPLDGKLYAPILIHNGKARPKNPPETQP